jgi:hypothetical protein
MERDMKIIMSALAASALLAGFAAPASADYRIPSIAGSYIGKYTTQPGAESDADKLIRSRRVLRDDDEEYIADSRDTGSGSWWRQMDREGRGGRK